GQLLIAVAGGTIVTPSVVQANSVTLTAGGAGGIASPGQPLKTDAVSLSLNDAKNGSNVFAEGTNPTGFTLGASSVSANFSLKSAGQITTTGAVNGGIITIESGGSGGITLGGQVGNATSQITLTTPGTGSITSKTAAAVVTGQTVAVNSSGGSIGTAS